MAGAEVAMKKGLRKRLRQAPARLLPRWLQLGLLIAVGEVCDRCGDDVGLVWTADDFLWDTVVGQPYGILCIRCFDRRARALGHFLRWRPEIL